MNRKQLTIILVLVAVLGAAGLVLRNSSQKSWSSNPKLGQKVMGNFQLNDVAQIHLIGDSELTLVKKEDRWCVQERGNYPANFSQISGFLLKLADLKIVQSEQVEPSQLAGLKLIEPGKGVTNSATVIELKDKNAKPIKAVLLGATHTRKSARPGGVDDEYPDGRYVMVRGEGDHALLISDPLGNSDPKPDQWLNKDFFRAEKLKSIAYTAANPTNSWKLLSATEGGQLTVLSDAKTNEVIDTTKTSSITVTLGSPNFVDVAVNPTPEKTGLDKPMLVNIETFDHFNYVLKIGKKSPENNYYMTIAVSADLPRERVVGKNEKPEDKAKLDKAFAETNKQLEEKFKQEKSIEQWTYLISPFVVDPLVRDRAQLMQEKEKPKDPNAKEQAPAEESSSNEIQEMPIVPELGPSGK